MSKNNFESGYHFDYCEASNPEMKEIPIINFISKIKEDNFKTCNEELDLSEKLGINYKATSPNLLVSFLNIKQNEYLEIKEICTTHVFYVIFGEGHVESNINNFKTMWKKGDLFVIPGRHDLKFSSSINSKLYWINDYPLLQYLKVMPYEDTFVPINVYTLLDPSSSSLQFTHKSKATELCLCGF